MGRLYQPSRSGRRWSIWWISYWDRSQRRELRESSGSRSRRVALKLLAQREAEAAARPIRQPDGRRRSALAHDGSRRGARGRQHHGLSLLRRAVQQLGPRPLDQALDPQSPIGRALAEWRRDLTTDLGGPESITTAQAGMVELAVRTKLMLDTVDGFILTMESPVNRRRRSVYSLPTKRRVLRMPRMTNSSGAAQSVTNSSGGSGRSKTFIGRSTPRRRRTSDRASGDEAADLCQAARRRWPGSRVFGAGPWAVIEDWPTSRSGLAVTLWYSERYAREMAVEIGHAYEYEHGGFSPAPVYDMTKWRSESRSRQAPRIAGTSPQPSPQNKEAGRPMRRMHHRP
jgi:hypothetical protein